MAKKEVRAVILAAGKGTRMRSDLPKVMHRISGKPMISYVIDACKKADVDKIYLVVGYGSDIIREEFGSEYVYIDQEEQLGTGHALMQAANEFCGYDGDILVVNGDGPFINAFALKWLIEKHWNTGAEGTFLTALLENTPPFGRIVRNEVGTPEKIVEEKDASPEIRAIKEVNTGHYCFRADSVFSLLSKLENDNAQGEYYLTDIMQLMSKSNMRIETVLESDPDIVFGINTMEELAEAERMMK
ncbi:MAG: NTP transferase domain-containing protein [bacterium]|nr:NTP transferase domain-containing protein [bacterium]